MPLQFKDEPKNLKALYRRAQAHAGTKDAWPNRRFISHSLESAPGGQPRGGLVQGWESVCVGQIPSIENKVESSSSFD